MIYNTLNLVDVSVGTRLLLADGSVAVVVENPGDGMWLYCRPDGSDDQVPEQPVFAQDVVSIAPSA